MQHVDTGDGHAQADLEGIHPAPFPLRGCGSPDGLGKGILESDPATFITNGINIGDIIADGVQTDLVIPHSGDPGKHGT